MPIAATRATYMPPSREDPSGFHREAQSRVIRLLPPGRGMCPGAGESLGHSATANPLQRRLRLLQLPRELDERLGLNTLIERHLNDLRTGRNCQFPRADLFRQSIYS